MELLVAPLILANLKLVVIGLFGGITHVGFSIAEHWNRSQQHKLPWWRYLGWLLFLAICLPMLGAAVLLIYIDNGDKISPLLAFQIGLTSPAIVKGMLSSAANRLAERPIDLPPNA